MSVVYVLNQSGQPLMPTTRSGWVYRVLRNGKAKVVSKCPFTIKLQYESTNFIQDVTLGIDTGSGTIGVAAQTNGKCVYASEIRLRQDIKSKMDARRAFRRNRRARKTRYRKPRFLNRRNSVRDNRYPPTLQSKLHSHIKAIEDVRKILPIKEENIILEIGNFDTTKLVYSSETENFREDGFYKKDRHMHNLREYILTRDGYTCQHCGKTHTRLEVHHIIFRSNGGKDSIDNLITLCEDCHKSLHRGEWSLTKKPKKCIMGKHGTHMNIIASKLQRQYSTAEITYGYITKEMRYTLKLEKTHWIDALCISSRGEVLVLPEIVYQCRCVPDGDFTRRTTVRKKYCDMPRGKIEGIRKFDIVKYFDNLYMIKGLMSSGFGILANINNEKVDFSNMPKGFKTPKLSNMTRVQARRSMICIPQKITLGTH